MNRFSFESLKAIPRFFEYRNDIDVYTEDKQSDKEFYKALFDRLTNKKVKINDITPLGCKANVLKSYDDQDIKSKRKKLFIVDGDLDLIIGTNRKSEKNLVILESYCIENYIIDEKSALEIIYYSDGVSDKATISKKLNFKKWIGYHKTELINLFLNFAILKMYGGGPKIASASKFLKTDKKQIILDSESIKNYTEAVKEEIIELLNSLGYKTPEEIYIKEFNRLLSKWEYSNDTVLNIVSGKDYLIHLLQHRVNYCIGKGKSMFPKSSFKLFLANHCDLERLEFLKKRII